MNKRISDERPVGGHRSDIETFLESGTASEESNVATVKVRLFEYDQYGFTAAYDAVAKDPDYFIVELFWSLSIRPGYLITEETHYLKEDAAYRERLKGKFRYFVNVEQYSGRSLRFLCIATLKKQNETALVTVYGQAFLTVA